MFRLMNLKNLMNYKNFIKKQKIKDKIKKQII